MYSLQDLLGLFDLNYSITLEDMKRAKKKVLMTHPDKSKLSPEYFLFYKKAFDIVVKFYENQTKQNLPVTTEKRVYDTGHQSNDKATVNAVSKNIQSMDKRQFNTTFNELFDKNMVTKTNPDRNQWFTNEAATYETTEKVSTQNMGQVFDKIKDTQRGMVKYRGVENLYMNSDFGNSIYDDENDDIYVSSDPFSKLKFAFFLLCSSNLLYKTSKIINTATKNNLSSIQYKYIFIYFVSNKYCLHLSKNICSSFFLAPVMLSSGIYDSLPLT